MKYRLTRAVALTALLSLALGRSYIAMADPSCGANEEKVLVTGFAEFQLTYHSPDRCAKDSPKEDAFIKMLFYRSQAIINLKVKYACFGHPGRKLGKEVLFSRDISVCKPDGDRQDTFYTSMASAIYNQAVCCPRIDPNTCENTLPIY